MLARTKTDAGTSVLDAAHIHELNHIESSYGQLVYLASLRNPDTGRYEYYGSANPVAELTESNRAVRKIHEQVFGHWSTLSLRRKMLDIELYISGIDQIDRGELIDAWLRLTPYRNLVPANVQGPEREKHFSDCEAILGLLKNVYGVSLPDLGV
jgi:hypothetical protein